MRDASKFLLMSNFFEELQRRKVYRVAAAYIIAAGFIIQIGSAVFPAWELPNWAFRLVVVFLLIGFPISLILAWAYDITPQGIRATPAPRTHAGRYPDQSFKDRRSEGHLAHVGHVVSGRCRAQRPRDRQSTGRSHASGRQRPSQWQPRPSERSVDQRE